MIDDLLTMARSDIDALALQRRLIDFAQPLNDAQAQAQALGRERRVSVQLAPLPATPLPLLADPQRLRQLLTVLLDNAIRYSNPDSVVQVQVHCTDEPAPRCVFEVHNTGIAIAEHELPRVFERNFRGEQARRHRADGSGLGLAIGAALARAHGGEIRLVSHPSRGTTATLWLPIAPNTNTEAT